ncbi:MAG: hypothetical protein SFY69_09880 [Planctomycetota bacterium]|nr:hypothetical protein [Planctomycetota bacterium]
MPDGAERPPSGTRAPPRPRIPPYLKRRVVILILASVGAGLLAPVASLGLSNGTIPRWAFILGVTIPGVASGLIGAFLGVAVQREQKKAAGAGGRRCWSCGYALHGLGDAGSCPECGVPFRLADLREKWGVPDGG